MSKLGLTIDKNLVSSSRYSLKCPNLMTPIGITVHNTANDASADNEIKYMITNDSSTSFHYAVDEKHAVQGLPLDRNGWHASDGGNGPGNRKTIAIEIARSTAKDENLFIGAEQNGAKLVAILLDEYKWDISHVYTHQHWDTKNHKYCPHKTLDWGWNRFLGMVKNYLADLQKAPIPTPTPTPSTSIKVGALVTIKSGAKYANVDKTVPSWALNEKWYVDKISGDRALLGKNEKKNNELTSWLFIKDLSVTSASSAPATTPTPSKVPASNTSYSRKEFITDLQKAFSFSGKDIDGIAGPMTLGATITLSKTINRYHKAVAPVQRYLNSLGYNCGDVDGIFGNKTHDAVMKYQEANECVVDGEITAKRNTWKKLLGLL